MLRLMFSRRWWWTTLIVIVGIGVAIRMGVWQLDRNAERQAGINDVQTVQAWGDEPGYAILTPLILPDGRAVMVERGWIPSQYNLPTTWSQFDESGTVTVEGVLRLPMEKGEMGGGIPDPTLAPGQTRLDFWNFVNLRRLQEQIPYSIMDVYIQQSPTSAPEALPYRWLSQPDLDPGAHIGFALMWFFYAGLLLFGYPTWLKKQKQKSSTVAEGDTI
jgi:surfeit locus 1 family protein